MTKAKEWLDKLNDIAIISRNVYSDYDVRVAQAERLARLSKELLVLARQTQEAEPMLRAMGYTQFASLPKDETDAQ